MDIARINNRKNFLLDEIPIFHPESIKYIEFWREQKRRIIEGYWAQDTKDINEKGMWRFMPPQLYFYVNFCKILHKPEGDSKTAPRKKIRPNLDDIDWDFFYKYLEAKGFSGFELDDEYTCCRDIIGIENNIDITLPNSVFNSQGNLKKYVPTREYINKLFDRPLGIPIYENEAKNIMLLGSRGIGKELADYEPVMTLNGEKSIGDVEVGDDIFDESGNLTKVKAVYKQGVKPMYKITFTDGREIDAGLEHLWEVYEYNKQKRIYTTQQIINKGLNYKHSRSGVTYRFYLPQNSPVQFEEKQLPIPPYVLGALLGDGSISGAAIKISSNDMEIIDRFRDLLPDYTLNKDTSNNNYIISYKYKKAGFWKNPLKEAIINLGVNKKSFTKFIPEMYKYSSVEQRLEIVRGLLDTDGSINKDGAIEFCSVSKLLLEDLAYIIRSLGIRCQIGEEKREGELHTLPTGHVGKRSLMYRLFIRTDLPVFYLPRKLSRITQRKNTSRIAIKTIEYKQDYSATCIEVDNKSKLFLTRNFIVTHNSYWAGDGCVLHLMITDGAIRYDEDSIKNPATVEAFVGAAIASKSAELLQKTEMGMLNLPGVWKPNTNEEVPSPLYKKMAGTLGPNNIKNPWRHEYEKKMGGEWKKCGTGSSVKHGIWTTENPEAAAGGRYILIIGEEVGLIPNILTIHGSNEAAQRIEYKLGPTFYLGTGGNIEKIIESEIIFRDPDGFDMLGFDDIWEGLGKIGYFIPATYADRRFKDSEGNTKIEEATKFYEERRSSKKKAKSGTALDMEMMNYPLKPSEMFINKSNNKFPIADLKQALAELLTDDKSLAASWKGEFIIKEDGKPEWKNTEDRPIREFPLKKGDSMEGCWEIFQMPIADNAGGIPNGRYIAALDPIDDDDNKNSMRSMQSAFIYDTFIDKIVAEYTSRTKFAKDYYEQLRRALLFFNARLLYENQKKGIFAYFEQKNSLWLLEDTPEILKDVDMQKISLVGNRSKGIYATVPIINWGIDLYAQWLISQAIGRPEGVTNAHTLRSVALIRESIMYNKDINTDRISSIIVLMIFRESKLKYVEKKKKQSDTYDMAKDKFWDKHFQRVKGYTN